jgi:DNA-binding CsgD family transcriptional regulator
LADNNIEMERYDSAMVYLRPLLTNVHKNVESAIYTNASRIYYHQGKLDSALYYIGKVLDVGNIYGKKVAYRNRTRIDLIRGDLASAKSDFENFVLYIDTIDHIRASEALANASAAYDYSMKEQENTRLQEENQQRAFWGWVMALACALLLTVLFLAITFYKKRRAEDAARSMALEMALDKLTLKTSEHVAAKQGEINQLIDKIRDMKNATDSERQATQNEIDTLKKQIALLSSASMRDASLPREVVEQQERFRSFSQEGRTPEDGDWRMLEDALKDAFPRLFEVLSKGLHLSMMEERVCWLTKLGLKPSQTARLVGRSAQAITSIRSRLYRKIFCEEGSPEDFDRFIHDL